MNMQTYNKLEFGDWLNQYSEIINTIIRRELNCML